MGFRINDVQYNGVNYYYLRNLQGDVTGIYDSNGNVVAKYLYDTWGTIVSVTDANGNEITDPAHIGNMNPIRYRGYYYDTEIGYYYLQSRYYNPEWGRFLNADALFIAGSSLTGANMFAYCLNNPVMFSDHSGLISNPLAPILRIFVKIAQYVFKVNLNDVEEELASQHPIAAINSFRYSRDATKRTDEVFGHHLDGTDANAFRHAYWCALMAYYIGPDMSLAFSDAHEATYPTSEDLEMDLHNNSWGILIGWSVKLAVDAGNDIIRYSSDEYIPAGTTYYFDLNDPNLAMENIILTYLNHGALIVLK
jgi:RHS repeat-associated protein